MDKFEWQRLNDKSKHKTGIEGAEGREVPVMFTEGSMPCLEPEIPKQVAQV